MTLNASHSTWTEGDCFIDQPTGSGAALKNDSLRNQGFEKRRAVVDWITFVVELKHSSHGGYLKTSYEDIGVTYARPLDKGAGGAANRFRIHLQHPDNFGIIDALLTDLDVRYGLAYPVELEAIEVSVDFYHESACPAALSTMTQRLMNAITPPVITNPRVFGDRFDIAGGHLPSRQPMVSADRTLYIGNDDDDMMWRVYFKRTDDTYEGEVGRRVPKPLPPTEWRARVEVRLQGEVLRDLGLTHAKDLEHFTFERLHTAKLFKFTKRIDGRKPLLTNPWSQAAAKSLGDGSDWPSCIVNRQGRHDSRGRMRQTSRHLVTDRELTEASRLALRGLTGRFGRAI